MARRKETALQEVISCEDEWDVMLAKEGLLVVDVYEAWCGPCKAVQGIFRRIKMEQGGDNLIFAMACTSLKSFENYRGLSEPHFLVYGSGQLIATLIGCNAPLLMTEITEKLKTERKILRGELERPQYAKIDDEGEGEGIENTNSNSQLDENRSSNSVVPNKQIALMVIKPDISSDSEKVKQIFDKIEFHGMEVVSQAERQLDEDEVKHLYPHLAENEKFEDVVKHMTSGPVLAIGVTKGETGEGVIELCRSIIGPYDPEEARAENPESIRAELGTSAVENAIHASKQGELVNEMAFFFPSFSAPKAIISSTLLKSLEGQADNADAADSDIERTITIIRPDALATHREAILKEIHDSGFSIVREKEMQLTVEQATEFYSSHKDEDYFEKLINQMTKGPSLILCLAREEAISTWRSMLGPKVDAVNSAPESLRGKYGNIEELGDINPLHAATSSTQVNREINMIFGENKSESAVAIIKPDATGEQQNIIEHLRETGFQIREVRNEQLSRDVAEKIYRGKKGEPFFEELIDHMTSGECKLLLLEDKNAIEKLRATIGPVDPEKAREVSADSIRAKFATSILQNAIHAPSNQDSTSFTISLLFDRQEPVSFTP